MSRNLVTLHQYQDSTEMNAIANLIIFTKVAPISIDSEDFFHRLLYIQACI